MYSLVVLVLIIVVVDEEEINLFFKIIKMTITYWMSKSIPWDYWIPQWPQGRVANVQTTSRAAYAGDPTGYNPNRRNITPNYNYAGVSNYGRYNGNYRGYNRGYNMWYWYQQPTYQTQTSTPSYDYQTAYRRLAQDTLAGFNNPNQSRDVMNYYNSIKNNPEAVAWTRRMLSGAEPRSIDYDIPNIDQYGNYNRINLNDPNNPEVISRFQTKAGRARMNNR